MTSVAARLGALQRRIRALECRHDRAIGSVRLLAVSKTHGSDAVRAAFEAGQRDFGENQLQDALGKLDPLAPLPLSWHFIGHVQSNKTREIAARFDWVQSVDRERIAVRLNDHRSAAAAALNVCIQVNISAESSKSGVAPEEVSDLARRIAALPRLRLRGLMAIPRPERGLEAQRRPFRRLRTLLDALRADGFDLDTLSIGMSEDMEAAIAEGATMVRIGTAIFGPRRAPR